MLEGEAMKAGPMKAKAGARVWEHARVHARVWGRTSGRGSEPLRREVRPHCVAALGHGHEFFDHCPAPSGASLERMRRAMRVRRRVARACGRGEGLLLGSLVAGARQGPRERVNVGV